MRVVNDLAGSQTFTLRRAILLYENEQGSLATVHDVVHAVDKGAPILLPGHLLTREQLEDLTRRLSGAPQRRTLLPEAMLCFDSTRMAWWRPSRRAPIWFNTRDTDFDKDLDGKEVLHPALLFVAQSTRLSVLALAGNTRPNPGSAVYRAPYFNLYENGSMCAGDTRLPEALSPSDLPVWERAFYETRFTHANIHGGEIAKGKGGHDALWREMMRFTGPVFPVNRLVPLKKTVEEVVNG